MRTRFALPTRSTRRLPSRVTVALTPAPPYSTDGSRTKHKTSGDEARPSPRGRPQPPRQGLIASTRPQPPVGAFSLRGEVGDAGAGGQCDRPRGGLLPSGARAPGRGARRRAHRRPGPGYGGAARGGRYYVACVGQFKRGKSTLLNALVGEALLPCGAVPVTSAVTILQYGPEKRARVRFADGHEQPIDPDEIGAYVSESENPENRKGVRAVEVFLPSPLLAEGMCLVDTPGVGSVFTGNAAVTRRFVPHIDAALVVIGADPPISGEEVALVQDVARGIEHLVFALNKADRLSEHERSEGVRFAREVLSRSLGRQIGPVYQVSALERIERGATRDWAALQASIESLSREAGSDLVAAAESRGVARLARSLLRELDEHRDALIRPVEESERRIETLRAYVSSAERALQDLSVLLSAEEARTSREFRDRYAAYLPEAQAAARGELEQALRRIERRGAMRWEGFRLAQAIARRAWEAWRAETEPVAEETYRRITARFVEHANQFLTRLARSGEPGSENLPRSLGPEAGFRVRSRFYYTEILAHTFAPLRRSEEHTSELQSPPDL